ncbi:MAG TPA: hypothetical protein VHE81_05130 [Lacipirellulaceae bacterium]|nr:hypothetical protein [Lacipirellulaceae bacterium]
MAADNDSTSTLDRLGSSLTSAILGGLILWIGQTTFRHAGILASMDEKIVAINKQFSVVDQRQESMRKWLESMVSELKDHSRSQFTQVDGDKLATQVRQAEHSSMQLERRFADQLGSLEVKLAALETEHRDSKEVAALKMEIAELRGDLMRATVAQEAQGQTADRYAGAKPIYLPPVESRR